MWHDDRFALHRERGGRRACSAEEPLALLIGFALDQQVPVQTAFSGPLKLKQRFGTLDARKIATADPGASSSGSFREKPAIHRFPGSMAKRVQELAALVVDEQYGGQAQSGSGRMRLTATTSRKRIGCAPGFGEHEGQVPRLPCSQKRFGVGPRRSSFRTIRRSATFRLTSRRSRSIRQRRAAHKAEMRAKQQA